MFGVTNARGNSVKILNESGSQLKNIKQIEFEKNFKCENMFPDTTALGSAVVYNGEIHHFVGLSQTALTTNNIHYKFNGESWVVASTTPIDISGCRAVVYNGKIHTFGGAKNTYAHYTWDGSTWTKITTECPYVYTYYQALVYKNEIHILQGKAHFKWNGSTWTNIATIPVDCTNSVVAVYNNEIHFFGGGSSTDEFSSIHYKYNGSTWTVDTKIPQTLYASGVGVIDNILYLFCNYAAKQIGNFYNEQTIIYAWNGSTWTTIDTFANIEMFRCAYVTFNNRIYLIGGHKLDWFYENVNYPHKGVLTYGDTIKSITYK